MVKPLDLQDNISKTPIAQKMADEAHEGAEKAKFKAHQIIQEQLERKGRREARTLGDNASMNGVNPDASKGKKEKRSHNKRKSADTINKEVDNDLRLSKDEDDLGKGNQLDIKV
jgi:hypothetical protein